MENSLTDFEFASGIPGTLGGAVYMNAGAYGGEIKDVVKKVTALDLDTYEIIHLNSNELKFGYRKSIFQERNYLILTIELYLNKGNYTDIKNKFDELTKKRVEKQPMEYGSAGSTFKRPVGNYASKLIEDSGLKGYRINDAQVSEKHSGFIINRGNASYGDLIELIDYVKETVKSKFNVTLELEVKILKD